ncbi:MAG: phosphotransferase [Gammaproteobacteria bacterium]|nr:phosphotransferase [Gammaproteobacteria bacterium]
MSVFTPVGREELAEFLCNYSVGELQVHEGISDGIENTSYFVTTDRQETVLTLFETHTFEETGYFLDLMAHMAEHGVPSAHPNPFRRILYVRQNRTDPLPLAG